MNMMIIVIWLWLIKRIQAGTDFRNFMVLKNKRATEIETISVTDSHSLTECAVRCKLVEGCNKANYLVSRCELFRDVNVETVFIDEEESTFLCKSIFFIYNRKRKNRKEGKRNILKSIQFRTKHI